VGTRLGLAGANRIRNAEHKHKDTRSEFIVDQEHPSRFIQATSAVFQPEFLPSQVGKRALSFMDINIDLHHVQQGLQL